MLQCGSQTQGMVTPTCRKSLPTAINPVKKLTHRCAEKLASKVFLRLVKLTVNSNDHTEPHIRKHSSHTPHVQTSKMQVVFSTTKHESLSRTVSPFELILLQHSTFLNAHVSNIRPVFSICTIFISFIFIHNLLTSVYTFSKWMSFFLDLRKIPKLYFEKSFACYCCWRHRNGKEWERKPTFCAPARRISYRHTVMCWAPNIVI